MAAPFSAIIMVGALVLPDVIVGMTEASITRKPLEPDDAQALVDHRQRIVGAAHLGGADGMKDRGADVAGGLRQRCLVVARHAGARQDIPPDEAAASAGCATMRRVTRIESAATRRSSSVDR